MTSPTARSKALLRAEGCHVDIVEYWNSFTKRRKDLYGCIDLLAITDQYPKPIAVQVTTQSHAAARIKKIEASEYWPLLGESFLVQVHGWTKYAVGKRKRWGCRISAWNGSEWIVDYYKPWEARAE